MSLLFPVFVEWIFHLYISYPPFVLLSFHFLFELSHLTSLSSFVCLCVSLIISLRITRLVHVSVINFLCLSQ